MATAEGPPRAHDRYGRRRAFSSWMKRLANLKNPSSESSSTRWSNKRHGVQKGKKSDSNNKNTPYPLSGRADSDNRASREISNTPDLESNEQHGAESRSQSAPSLSYSGNDNQPPALSAKSTAPTDGEAGKSDEVYSKAGTLTTAGGGLSTAGGGEGSTFSSPAPSVRSLTTTLTTVQSAAPSNQVNMGQNAQQGLTHVNSAQSVSTQQVQFSHQFPTTPVSAVPPHLVPHGHQTYNTATANNLLTDNASMLTLASSSKRRRRNSVDTNASIRALPPSSIFSGSRESLPLSVLSGNAAESSNTSVFSPGGVPNRPSLVGLASTERASVYSSSGVAAFNNTGERASLNASRPAQDGSSIRSNSYSLAHNDSTAASASGGTVNSPLGGPVTGQSPTTNGRVSRRSSGWGEIVDDESVNEKQVEQKADEKSELKSQKSAEDPEKAPEQTTPKQEKFS